MMSFAIFGVVLAVVLAWAWRFDHRRRGTNGVLHIADDIEQRMEITEGEVAQYSPPFGPQKFGNSGF